MKAATYVRIVGVCLPLVAAGCTRDFSSFRFDDRAMPRETTMSPAVDEPEAGAHADARTGEAGSGLDASQTPKPDAASMTSDAADAAPVRPPVEMPDAAPLDSQPMPMPMPMPEPTDDDAGTASASSQCRAKWPELQVNDVGCRLCTCSECATEVVDCLTLGTERERMLCSDVLSCALQNHCQDYDCYCGTQTCGLPAPSGDGPCRGVMEAAAGGTRSKIMQLRRTLDPQEPFSRAVLAVSCLYGTNSMSTGPVVQEACATTCGM